MNVLVGLVGFLLGVIVGAGAIALFFREKLFASSLSVAVDKSGRRFPSQERGRQQLDMGLD